MLKGIPEILPPELMKILMEMGHGDELLIAMVTIQSLGCQIRLFAWMGMVYLKS
jgi:L-fucose mutarotase